MLGTIIDDIAGSLYEFESPKTKNMALFAEGSQLTHDRIMNIAAMTGSITEAYYGIPEEIKQRGIAHINKTISHYANRARPFVYSNRL